MRTSLAVAVLIVTATMPFSVADDLPAIVDFVASHREASPAASIPWDRYAGDLRTLPIGVFDSGIGGLTVLEAILKLDEHHNGTGAPGPNGVADFANEHFIYLGDQANMPYGNYSAVGRTDYLRELIVRDAMFLVGNRYDVPGSQTAATDKPPVKAIVIACNTATAYGLDDIRAALAKWNIPILVVGVVEAGGRGVIDAMREDTQSGAAAVLATVGTCSSGAYPRTIARLAGQQGLQAPVVHQHGSVGLAGAIEGNKSFVNADDSKSAAEYLGPSAVNPAARFRPELADAYGFDPQRLLGDLRDPATWRLASAEDYIRYDVATLVDEYARAGGEKPISTVVLGCTHFPLAATPIDAAFRRLRDYRDAQGKQPYHDLIAEKVTLVDPSSYTAKELYRGLFQARLLLKEGEACCLPRETFYVTVPRPDVAADALTAGGGFTQTYKYGRLPGRFDTVDCQTVAIESDGPSTAMLEPWRRLLPEVGKRLTALPE